jgi:hypothetical protein
MRSGLVLQQAVLDELEVDAYDPVNKAKRAVVEAFVAKVGV